MPARGQNTDSEGGWGQGAGSIQEFSVLAAQNCCGLKTALKNYNYFFLKKITHLPG
jgi:hypothetical protein